MDYKVINKAIAVTETLYDGFDERPVDCDFVLPDYYPDIAAVLKCTLKPVVQSKQLSGDRLIVDGTVIIQVLYLDESRKCVRSCEITKPFTSTFSVKAGVTNPVIRVTAKTEYVNCRAVSPRRLDIHGSFSVKLKMSAEGGAEVVSAINGDTMYTRKNVVTYSVPAMTAEKSFSVNEVLELSDDKPPAEALIRGDAVAVLSDCKLMVNKAIIKGEIKLCNLYTSDITNGDSHKTKHDIPFSQIIDIEGLDDEWQCDVHLDITANDTRITTNQNGEGKLLEVNLKLGATVDCYRTGMAEIVTDAYSTSYPVNLERKRLDTSHLVSINSDTSTVRETFDLPEEGVEEIIDVWCDVSPVEERCENGVSHITGRLMIYLLAKDGSGIVSFFERPADFKMEFDDNCTQFNSDMAVTNVDYNMSGADQIEIRAQLNITRRCFVDDSMVAVSSVLIDEDAAFPSEKAALKIYFANSGESVWEVAKACHTSMDAVMEENNLSSDVLAKDTMLLVPLC
jgi:hypothetical protein